MGTRIIAIRTLSNNPFIPATFETITHLEWVEESSQITGHCTRERMYQFIKEGNKAFVRVEDFIAYLEATENHLGTKYIRTIPDETKVDNLLSLPRF